MIHQIRFYEDDYHWYADIPNHSKEDNEMVGYCPLVLRLFRSVWGDDVQRGDVIMTVSDDNPTNKFKYKLVRKSHDAEGADYYVTKKPLFGSIKHGIKTIPCWLCNVVHDVFGEHPSSIYIHEIRVVPARNQQGLQSET